MPEGVNQESAHIGSGLVLMGHALWNEDKIASPRLVGDITNHARERAFFDEQDLLYIHDALLAGLLARCHVTRIDGHVARAMCVGVDHWTTERRYMHRACLQGRDRRGDGCLIRSIGSFVKQDTGIRIFAVRRRIDDEHPDGFIAADTEAMKLTLWIE